MWDLSEVQRLECALNTSVGFLVDNWGLIDGKMEGGAFFHIQLTAIPSTL